MIYFELIVKLYKKTKVNIKLHDTKLLWFISATISLGKIKILIFKKKVWGVVSPPHFVHDFSRRIFLMLYFIG